MVVSYELIGFLSGGNRYLIGPAGQFDSRMAGQRNELVGAPERRCALQVRCVPMPNTSISCPWCPRDGRVDSPISLLTPLNEKPDSGRSHSVVLSKSLVFMSNIQRDPMLLGSLRIKVTRDTSQGGL